LRLLARGTGLADVQEDVSKLDIALLLGGGVRLSGAFLVEDQAAKEFLTTVLDEKAPSLLKQYEIVAATSESHITATLKNMPNTGNWLTLVGAYDGDMRATATGEGFNWPHVFLPGTIPPEELLVDHLHTLHNSADLLAAELHKTAEQVTFALNHVAGADPHDLFTELGKALNLHPAIIRAACVRIWLQNTENNTLVTEFIAELQAAIKGEY
jgi:hypothetical protein